MLEEILAVEEETSKTQRRRSGSAPSWEVGSSPPFSALAAVVS